MFIRIKTEFERDLIVPDNAPRAEINLEALKWVKRKNLLGECSSVHWSEEGEDNFYRV